MAYLIFEQFYTRQYRKVDRKALSSLGMGIYFPFFTLQDSQKLQEQRVKAK